MNSIRNTISFLMPSTNGNDVVQFLLYEGFLKNEDIENIKVLVQKEIEEISEALSNSFLFSINGRGNRRIKPLNIGKSGTNDFAILYSLLSASSVLVFESEEDLSYSGLKRLLSNMGVGYYTRIEEMPAISEEACSELESRKEKLGFSCKFYHLHENIEHDKETKKSLRRSRREESRSCSITLDDFTDIFYASSIEEVIDHANGKQVVYILSERADVLPYVSNGKILFTSEYSRTPSELIKGLFVDGQSSVLIMKCSKTTAKNLKFSSREGFFEFTEWFRNKFMEVYGNIDFSCLPEFKCYNNDRYFLKDLSIKDVANVYSNFLEVATEEDLETEFFKLLNAEIGNAAEALKVITKLGESILTRNWFIKYLKSIQVDKEFKFVEKICSLEFTKKYPMLKYVKFNYSFYYSNDCGKLIKAGRYDNYDAPIEEILKSYREVLDYVLEVEKIKKSKEI